MFQGRIDVRPRAGIVYEYHPDYGHSSEQIQRQNPILILSRLFFQTTTFEFFVPSFARISFLVFPPLYNTGSHILGFGSAFK
ncbi:hypothetical protein LEP1GSC161_2198 [Leptospira santarosai str. CBC1416]|uniref:Uncharacterized protein n=1 Tax=Leptospira santarosai str. CBC1416 TaxID=1193059 RepID=M6VFB3_9LEPT|nr:hypothetical protein LEP1GSC161_2198 [Leptospira santarosai str. CBC1416]